MNRGDRWLIVLPLALTAVGVIMVYSSSAILGITRYSDAHHFLWKQCIRAALGVIALVACTRIDLRWLERWAPRLLAIAAIGLVLVVAMGSMSNGATRWFRVGFLSLQPTDFARFATVVFLAWWLKRRPPDALGFVRGTAPTLAIVAGMAGLILLQPNLSSAGLLGLTGLGLVFLAGAPLPHLAIPLGAGGLGVLVALRTHPYMMERVRTFVDFVIHGRLDQHGSGWQLDQSLIAIGSGGWLGRGLGGGLQKYLFLPEAHTDFIFSIYAEELGFVGATLLVAGFALLLWRGLRVTARATDPFLFLLAGGLTLQIGLYAVANLAAAGLLYRISAATESFERASRPRWAREGA